MKRGFCLLLALILLIACLASCGPQKPSNNPSGKTEDLVDNDAPLPKADYSKKTYTVLNREGTSFVEEWSPNDSLKGDVINDAVASRNQAVVDQYGVNLDFESARISPDFDTYFWPRIISTVDDDMYQLVAAKTYDLAAASVKGYFLNWRNSNQIPVVNIDADWWDGEFIRTASYNGCAYIATGPLSLTDMYSSTCIYFNKDLLNKYMGSNEATNDLFKLIEDGGWTLDKLQDYAAKCTEKFDGDETGENTVYGFATERNTTIDAFIYSSNLAITERKNGTIVLKTVDANNRILELASTLDQFLNHSGNAATSTSDPVEFVGKFVQGKAVFSTGLLRTAKDIQSYASQIQYGVIPYPKLDANQAAYHTYKTDNKSGFCIPRSVKEDNREFVGTITEALAYYSNKYVKPALYEKVLTHKNVQDEKSSNCVTLILNGGLYEFSNIYADAWGDMQSPAHQLRQCLKEGTDYYQIFRGKQNFYEKHLKAFLAQFVIEDTQ